MPSGRTIDRTACVECWRTAASRLPTDDASGPPFLGVKVTALRPAPGLYRLTDGLLLIGAGQSLQHRSSHFYRWIEDRPPKFAQLSDQVCDLPVSPSITCADGFSFGSCRTFGAQPRLDSICRLTQPLKPLGRESFSLRPVPAASGNASRILLVILPRPSGCELTTLSRSGGPIFRGNSTLHDCHRVTNERRNDE